jgi:hypothetical protein
MLHLDGLEQYAQVISPQGRFMQVLYHTSHAAALDPWTVPETAGHCDGKRLLTLELVDLLERVDSLN